MKLTKVGRGRQRGPGAGRDRGPGAGSGLPRPADASNGRFEVIQQLRGGAHLPVIIVVTAYDQYAIRAFDEGAVDYLLKPVAQPRLLRALDRARQLQQPAGVAENLARLQEIAGAPAPRRLARSSAGREKSIFF